MFSIKLLKRQSIKLKKIRSIFSFKVWSITYQNAIDIKGTMFIFYEYGHRILWIRHNYLWYPFSYLISHFCFGIDALRYPSTFCLPATAYRPDSPRALLNTAKLKCTNFTSVSCILLGIRAPTEFKPKADKSSCRPAGFHEPGEEEASVGFQTF